MARPRRPLTDAERARPCGFCGAKAGEHCANPNGSTYPSAHVARTGRNGRATRQPYARSPRERYPVTLCGSCAHPGGQHAEGKGCRLCRDCTGWNDANMVPGHWNDQMTNDLLAEMETGEDAR